jgi:hypothetical protein
MNQTVELEIFDLSRTFSLRGVSEIENRIFVKEEGRG